MGTSFRICGRLSRAAPALLCLLFAEECFAQGLPVDMGSHIPLAIIFAGTAMLGLVLAYGIIRNRSSTKAEKRMTERATKDLYAEEDRQEKSGKKS